MNSRDFHMRRARWVLLPGIRDLKARHDLALRTLAHDLRNPINSILLMAQLLEESGGTPESARIAKRIQRQCEELSGMVDRALD